MKRNLVEVLKKSSVYPDMVDIVDIEQELQAERSRLISALRSDDKEAINRINTRICALMRARRPRRSTQNLLKPVLGK